ncbi:hypothetical protein COT99_01755 [Candidatus Falkowbacteria bacterium CG10_big_fil_rev_8_21_14_0_10_43_10]|uniref:Uncharacterized protein n=1 Tax=Candidatus Falkowbacteria bacterium CG10_big_fil_rev_8_21_14_0_10_43_10 TaxID=1974567 RepID=A0A2H0V2D6_9BACT|nr:MAG: hypothetical protein AUJ71_01615 [Candidatus Omnitrophica bacterium CG1_02_49_16]PIR93254.1 MAG: hypothetical protein COT99_01755 [Candidatus Falkowbacteria bacterium CG10_big_fil_rev_8_21_14_0_10_43_10]
MVELVGAAPENVVATITPQHVIISTSDVLDASGCIVFPHNYCKPIAKSREDVEAVIQAMISGSPKFFLGTDSAPHSPETKCYRGENGEIPPNAGIFNEIVALPLYLSVFERWIGLENGLHQFEAFCSLNGPKFHSLKPSEETITLVREPWMVPEKIKGVVPFIAENVMNWKIVK